MQERTCDTLILGAGGGGYPAAFRLVRQGQQVVMVDPKGNLGGHCLFEGCIPSKTVREGSRLVALARAGGGGGAPFALEGPLEEAWPKIRAFKDGVQTRRYAQHAREVEEAKGLTLLRGEGKLTDPFTAEVVGEDGEWRIRFRHAILATGSSARHLAVPGAEHAWTSRELFAWREATPSLPERLVIVGAGYIGVEMAMMLHPLGVRVTVLELEPHILPGMDPDIQRELDAALREVAQVELRAQVTAVVSEGPYQRVVYRTPSGEREVLTDRVIAAVGRTPNVTGLGLEAAGVAATRRGIAVDRHLRTRQPHIYATGDVTGLSMLFHSAVRMSEVAAHNILAAPEPVDAFSPLEMPATVFSNPEACTVGLTVEAAKEQGLEAVELRREMGREARAQIGDELRGFLKLVVDRASRRILGVHCVGIDAAALSSVAHILVRHGLTVDEAARLTFPHPTQFEALDRLARDGAQNLA